MRLSVLARLGMTRAMSIDDNSGTDDDGTGEGLRVILQLEPVSYGSTALNSAYHQEGQRRQVYSPVDGSSMGGSDERGHRPKRPRDPLYQLSSKLDGPANVAAPGAKRMASQVKRRYQGSSTELRVEALLAERLHRRVLVSFSCAGLTAVPRLTRGNLRATSRMRAPSVPLMLRMCRKAPIKCTAKMEMTKAMKTSRVRKVRHPEAAWLRRF